MIFFSAPLLYLIFTAITGKASAASVWRAQTAWLVVQTLVLATCSTLWALALGLPLAWLVQRTDMPGRRLWRWLGSLPLAIPPYIGALSYLMLLGPGGVINQWYQQRTGGYDLLVNIYGLWGGVFVLGLFTYPFVFVLAGSVLESTDPSLEEAAHGLGLRWRQVLWRVTLPLLRPSILAAALLTFLYALSDFGAVSILRVTTFTTEIYRHLNTRFDHSAAALLSLMLVLMTLFTLVVQRRLLGRRSYVQTSGRSRPPQTVLLGRWRWPAVGFPALVILLALVAPVGILIYQAAPVRTFLTTIAEQTVYLAYSLSTALAAATIILALALSFTATRLRRNRVPLALLSVQLGYAIPGTVMGLSLILLYNLYVPWVYGTVAMVVVGYVARFSPQAVQGLGVAFEQVHQHLDEAGRNLGHRSLSVLRRILVPLITPGLIATWTLVFISSMKELAATILLRPAGFDTLPVRIWIHTVEADYTKAAGVSLVLIATTALPLLYLNARRPS